MKQYKLIIFDMDGTLADFDTAELLDGVKEYFDGLEEDNNTQFALATNQGGVGLRYWMEKDGFGEPEKYPTYSEVMTHIRKVLSQISADNQQIEIDLNVCFAYISRKGKLAPVPDEESLNVAWNHNCRKPNPGMLMNAISNAKVKPVETLMVGDRPEDKEAARRAGCDFMWAWDFFERDEPAET